MKGFWFEKNWKRHLIALNRIRNLIKNCVLKTGEEGWVESKIKNLNAIIFLNSLWFSQLICPFMKESIMYFLVALFAIFLGSQITEALLLVPYWQSLSAADFYSYYQKFGPLIGRFYTILTIIALLIPIGLSVYLFSKQSTWFFVFAFHYLQYWLYSLLLAFMSISRAPMRCFTNLHFLRQS